MRKTGHTSENFSIMDRSYECQYCKKLFIAIGHVRGHERIHTGTLTALRAQILLEEFHDVRHLQSHERIHTDERPYTCAYMQNL